MASQKIQGLNIKLSADTTAVTNALKDVDKALSSTEKELKAVDKGLKYNPDSVVLLAQKQQLLSNAIDQTSKKLEELRKIKELADKDTNVDKQGKEYRELSRQIEDTTNKLKTHQEQLRQTNIAFDTANDSSRTFKDTLKAVFTGDLISRGIDLLKSGLEAVVNLTKQAINGLVSLVKQGVQYNATMQSYETSIKAMLDDDNKATQKLVKSMKQLGSESGYANSVLLEGARNLLSADIGVDNVEQTLVGLSKALAYVGGSNDDLSRMITNLQGIASTGKATAQDLKQFKNIGLNVTKLIADQTGKTTEQVEKAGVTYQMLSDALIKASESGGKFADTFTVNAGTFQNQVNKLQSSWENLLGNLTLDTTSAITTTILPSINGMLADMNTAFEEGGMQGLQESFSKGLENVINTISSEGVIEQVLSGANNIIDTIASAFDPETEQGKRNRDALEKATAKILEVITHFIEMNKEPIANIGKMIGGALIEGIAEAVNDYFLHLGDDLETGAWVNGVYFDTSQYKWNGKAVKYSASQSGGFGSGGFGNQITLNASFVANGTLDEAQAMRFADLMTQQINENLGGQL